MGKIKMEAKIVRQDEIATDIYSMVIQAPEIASQAVPGQFIDLYSADGSKLLPRPISLAALTILDVSPANQVLCAAKAGYSHVGIRLVPATPTETQYDMIGNTPMIREVEANLKATGIKVLDIEILRIKPDTRAVNWKAFFETGTRLGATQVLCAGNDPDINRLTDNYAELCELAHPYGLNLSIEPMP